MHTSVICGVSDGVGQKGKDKERKVRPPFSYLQLPTLLMFDQDESCHKLESRRRGQTRQAQFVLVLLCLAFAVCGQKPSLAPSSCLGHVKGRKAPVRHIHALKVSLAAVFV